VDWVDGEIPNSSPDVELLEEYNIEEVNEFHDVTGWHYDDKPENLLVESTHNIYYPANKI
jgi:hypothetical protein